MNLVLTKNKLPCLQTEQKIPILTKNLIKLSENRKEFIENLYSRNLLNEYLSFKNMKK